MAALEDRLHKRSLCLLLSVCLAMETLSSKPNCISSVHDPLKTQVVYGMVLLFWVTASKKQPAKSTGFL